MSSKTPYDGMLGPTPFSDAVDKAIAEFNDRPFTEADIAEAKANAERWRAIGDAKVLAGEHGVVIPVATARKILEALKGEDTGFFTNDLLARMLASNIPD